MLTLNKFGLSNFRVFKEYTEFEFAPLTILTGANNSGKSSLLKALLLIQDNARRNKLSKLEFDGGEHNLGSWEFAKNKYSETEELSFTIGFIPRAKKELFLSEFIHAFAYQLKYTNELDKLSEINLTLWVGNKKVTNVSEFMLAIVPLFSEITGDFMYCETHIYNYLRDIKLGENNLPYLLDNDILRKIFDEKYHDILADFAKDVLNPAMWHYITQHEPIKEKRANWEYDYLHNITDYFYFDNLRSGDILPFLNTENKRYAEIIETCFYHNKQEYVFTFPIIRTAEPFIFLNNCWDRNVKQLFDFFYDLKYEFTYLHFSDWEIPDLEYDNQLVTNYLNYEYLGVMRGKQKRLYQNTDNDSELDKLLPLFLKKKYENTGSEYLFINKWMKEFGFSEEVKFNKIMNNIFTEITFFKNGQEQNISDLGFGLTQLLPLLMKIVLSQGKLLLLEEPETNLHPSLQARLADLLIDAHRTFDIQFIVETHSEYLIRRMQVLTAKYEEAKRKEQDTNGFIAPDESVIYYFYEPNNIPEGRKQVERINILEDGRLDNDFGEGFLDEASSLQFDLSKLKSRLNKA